MFDKERFHNALALSLGYERIVKNNRITIQVDDSDDPWVTLKFLACPKVIHFKASDNGDVAIIEEMSEMREEIQYIVDAVHQASVESLKLL